MTDDRETVLHHLLEDWASAQPDRTFLIEGDRRVNYDEALEQSGRIANWLLASGLERGDRVAIMHPAGIDYVLWWLGICRAGGIASPVNDAYRGFMLTNQLRDSEPSFALVHSRHAVVWADVVTQAGIDVTTVQAGTHEHPDIGLMPGATPVDVVDEVAPVSPPRWAHAWDQMALLYTSGTTGPSKGVMYGYGHAHATARPVAEGCRNDDVFYTTLPMFHTGLPHVLGAVLQVGCTMAIRPKFSRSEFWADVHRFGATVTMLISNMTSYLLASEPSELERGHRLERVFMTPLHRELAAFKRRTGVERVATLFNMTEASSPIVSSFDEADVRVCGVARPGVTLRLVDEHDRQVERGDIGELVIRTDHPWEMSLGYWRNPEATAASWRNQWMHTGDLLSQDASGKYRFHDRSKDVIRRRGENISAYELEREIGAHPQIAECAAVAVPDPMGDQEVKVVYYCGDAQPLSPREFWRHFGPLLPAYMLPRYLELRREELPKTPTGKIVKGVLRDAGIGDAVDRTEVLA